MVRKDKHHMIFGRRAWTNKSQTHREVRQHPAFMYNDMDRTWHSVLHKIVGVVPIPDEEVAYDLLQMADATMKLDRSERVDHQLELMSGYIVGHNTPAMAREMSLVMGSFAAQQGIIQLSETNRRIQ